MMMINRKKRQGHLDDNDDDDDDEEGEDHLASSENSKYRHSPVRGGGRGLSYTTCHHHHRPQQPPNNSNKRLVVSILVITVIAASFVGRRLRHDFLATTTTTASSGGVHSVLDIPATSSRATTPSLLSSPLTSLSSSSRRRRIIVDEAWYTVLRAPSSLKYNDTLRTIDNNFKATTPSSSSSSSCPGEQIDSGDSNINIRTTLVIQCTLSRLWLVEETCRRWKDPIVLVVSLSIEEQQGHYDDFLRSKVSSWKRGGDDNSQKCPQLSIIEYHLNKEQSELGKDPLNLLRNVGLDAVVTRYVLVADVDLIPSTGLDDKIRTVLLRQQQQQQQQVEHHDDAIVIPAFERFGDCTDSDECSNGLKRDSSFIPQSFDSLKECIAKQQCDIVKIKNNKPGHSSTRSEDWLQRKWYDDDDDNYEGGGVAAAAAAAAAAPPSLRPIRSIKCIYDVVRYEPYVVLRWCPSSSGPTVGAGGQQRKVAPLAPYYDERFHGYGKDKVAYTEYLRLTGYRFSVLPEGFVVHHPHPDSNTREFWRDKSTGLMEEMMITFTSFHDNLSSMYNSKNNKKNIIPPCLDCDKAIKPKATREWVSVNGRSQFLPPRTLLNTKSHTNKLHCKACLNKNDIHTTLVLQCSIDRAWILNHICERWRHPIITVVAVKNPNERKLLLNSVQNLRTKCPQLLLIDYLLDDNESANPGLYPVNKLRNAGLNQVRTSHILLADIDFIPSHNLHEHIRRALLERQLLRYEADARGITVPKEGEEAIVVPAFERISQKRCKSKLECKKLFSGNSSFIPRTFDELKDCYDKKDCIVFANRTNVNGHYSTRSEEWLQRIWYEDDNGNNIGNKATTGRKARNIRSIKCIHDTSRYEPYLVLRWCPLAKSSEQPLAPYYDERFFGYGNNKIQLIEHLRRMGFKFSVLPEGFLVHNPHVESDTKMVWKDTGKDLRSDMDELYAQFVRELAGKYDGKVPSIVGTCDDEDEAQ